MNCKKEIHEHSTERIKTEGYKEMISDRISLVNMEDHIIDSIIGFLNLHDCKSISLTCRKFNDLFSKSRHMDKFWLNMKHVRPLTVETLMKSPRVHKNMTWNEEMPMAIIEYLSPNLKRLQVTMSPEFPRDIVKFLVEFLPYLANLTDFRIYYYSVIPRKIDPSQFTNFKRVEMKQLEYLRIDGDLSRFLLSHCIEITSENLHTLILCAPDENFSEINNISSMKKDEFLPKLRDVISKQNNLQELVLEDVKVGTLFFDKPIILQRQLKELSISDMLNFYEDDNPERFNNFFNFMMSQNELKELYLSPPYAQQEEQKEKIRILRQKRLDLKLTCCMINYSTPGHVIECMYFEAIDESLFIGKPNCFVRKIILQFYFTPSGDVSHYLNLMRLKFPNIEKLEILLYTSKDKNFQWNFSAINAFENLRDFKIGRYEGKFDHRILETISIPLLQSFKYSIPFQGNTENLLKFLSRHTGITLLEINIDGDVGNVASQMLCPYGRLCQLSISVFEIALETLRNIQRLRIWIGVPNQKNYNKGCKRCMAQDYTSDICKLIDELARPGFELEVLKLEIKKGTDNRIMNKNEEKRWKLVEGEL